MRNKRNKSHCSVFSCVPEYRHIQGWIPILMPSGKASCGNSSDEAVETQSFNLWFLASEYTHEKMTLAMAVKQQHKTRLHSANLSRQDYIFFIYVQSIDTAPCDFLSSDWLIRSESHACQVCDFSPALKRQASLLWALVYLLLQFNDQCV